MKLTGIVSISEAILFDYFITLFLVLTLFHKNLKLKIESK